MPMNLWIYITELVNLTGLAWWIEVKTLTPDCIYFFGPFLTCQEAQAALPGYVEDLEAEKPKKMTVTIKRCQPSQLTVCW